MNLDAWLAAMNGEWWRSHMSVEEYLAMEPNDVQPAVETEREKAAYQRGYAAGVAAGWREASGYLVEGGGLTSYGTDPTWPRSVKKG